MTTHETQGDTKAMADAEAKKNEPVATEVRLRTLLAEVQWGGPVAILPTHRSSSTCPVCRAAEANGHAPDCRLKAELHP